MQELKKVLETKHLIRFPDCDPFNHLNNSRYLDYFINAREDHLQQFHDFNIYERLQDRGLSWVIGKNEIVYIRPALLMETVIIRSTILSIDERSILVEMSMRDVQKKALKALLWTTFVYYNLKTQRPENHDPEFITAFQPFENPLPTPLSIEERAKQIRNSTGTV